MRCPYCDYMESKVLDSRPTEEGAVIRRRRECLSCKERFTTYEKKEVTPLVVRKKDGSRESFDGSKLLNGIIKSCEKRPVTLQEMEDIVNDIEKSLQNKLVKEVPSTVLGEMVMDHLKEVDEVSYVRFASVYRQFRDVESFIDELETLIKEKKE